MPKDYRKRRKSRSSSSSSGNNFVGIIFGVMIGLLLAVIGYWKLSAAPEHHAPVSAAKAPALRSEEAAPKKPSAAAAPEFDFYTVLPKMQVEPNHPAKPGAPPVGAPHPPAVVVPVAAPAATAEAPPPSTAPSSTPSVAASSSKPLEAPLAASTSQLAPASPTTTHLEAKAPEEKAVAVKTTPTKSNEASSYLLQMASFKNYADADRLKAQLTMLGFDVYIQSYGANGHVYNRVVIGPYSSKSAALQHQTQLQKDHVTSILIKAP